MRYLGQSWEIDVDVPPEMTTVAALEAAFHDTHERRFGHRNDGETEVVSFRLTGIGGGSKPAFGAWRVSDDLAGARVETTGGVLRRPVLRHPGARARPAAGRGPPTRVRRSSRRKAPPPWFHPFGASGCSTRETC